MPSEQNKLFPRKWSIFLTGYCLALLLLAIISYHPELDQWFSGIVDLFRPVLLGLAIAYIANPTFRFYERILFARLRLSTLRRAISLLCTYLTIFLAAALLLLMILPQMIAAITSFVANYQSYVDSAIANINGIFDAFNAILGKVVKQETFFEHINDTQFFDGLYTLAVDFLENMDVSLLTNTASTLISAVTDTIFALFISLYFLSTKEKRYAQVMKLRIAVFSNATNLTITRLCTTADNLFGKFFKGKFVDSVIIGLLLYLLFLIFGIPFAILIAAFIAITNIIPMIGFVIGAIPAALIVLLTAPERILPFLIIVFIVFQIDSNIISPKIVGSNTGISSLCVIIAVCVTGRLWGITGMLLGVPLFATALDFSDHLIHRRLQRKRLPDDVENYYAPDPIIDPMKHHNTGTARVIRHLEKSVLRAKKKIDSGNENELSAGNRFLLFVHKHAHRLHLLPQTPLDILTQFAAENAETQIRAEAAKQLEAFRNVGTEEPTNTDNTEEGGLSE